MASEIPFSGVWICLPNTNMLLQMTANLDGYFLLVPASRFSQCNTEKQIARTDISASWAPHPSPSVTPPQMQWRAWEIMIHGGRSRYIHSKWEWEREAVIKQKRQKKSSYMITVINSTQVMRSRETQSRENGSSTLWSVFSLEGLEVSLTPNINKLQRWL